MRSTASTSRPPSAAFHLAVGGQGATDCVGCRFDLVDERRCCRQFARKEMHVHPLGEGQREVAKRSCPTGESHVPPDSVSTRCRPTAGLTRWSPATANAAARSQTRRY